MRGQRKKDGGDRDRGEREHRPTSEGDRHREEGTDLGKR